MVELKQNNDGTWSEMAPEPYKPNWFERMFPVFYEKLTYWLGWW